MSIGRQCGEGHPTSGIVMRAPSGWAQLVSRCCTFCWTLGWSRRSRLGTSRHFGNLAYAATASGTVQFSRVVQSVGEALELCAGLTPFGRHGEAAWCGQEDAGGTRAAFRAGGRQLAFRHRSQLGERSALLAHILVRRHRPSDRNASCGGPVRRECGKQYQLTAVAH
jgi:hypothetical protein